MRFKIINDMYNRNKKLFISWSGENGKEIALKLKDILEKDVFNKKLSCFVSVTDIESGELWWNRIKRELTTSSVGIVCITKENVKAPWIYYEAGALVGNNIRTIPLLFNCNFKILDNTPLKTNQIVSFADRKKFAKMILDINGHLNVLKDSPEQIRLIANSAHEKICNELKDVFDRLKQKGYFNEQYVYPQNIHTIDRNSVFVSAPMSTLNPDEYQKQRTSLLKILDNLKKIGFTKVICPAAEIEDKKHFDGREKSIRDNFTNLKQVECFVLIYEHARPSSVMVELGYAIAISKKTVVFYKRELPFLVQKAGENIPHIRTVKFKNYEDIINEIIGNKMALFENDKDEND
jgi:hypothetical protein